MFRRIDNDPIYNAARKVVGNLHCAHYCAKDISEYLLNRGRIRPHKIFFPREYREFSSQFAMVLFEDSLVIDTSESNDIAQVSDLKSTLDISLVGFRLENGNIEINKSLREILKKKKRLRAFNFMLGYHEPTNIIFPVAFEERKTYEIRPSETKDTLNPRIGFGF